MTDQHRRDRGPAVDAGDLPGLRPPTTRWRHFNAVGVVASALLVVVAGCTVTPIAERSTSPIPRLSLPAATAADGSEPPAPTDLPSPPAPTVEPSPPSSSPPSSMAPPSAAPPDPLPTLAAAPLASLASGPLRIDGLALVVIDGLRVRSAPGTGTDSKILAEALPKGSEVFVVDGPTSANEYAWWQVQGVTGLDIFGWVAAAGRDGEVWLAPATVACPDQPTVGDLARLGGARSLVCYGGRELQIRAFRQEICGDGAAVGDGSPGWIYGNFGGDPLFDREAQWNDWTAVGIHGRAHPSLVDSGTEYFGCNDAGIGWFDVTGHFDDPASRDCRYVYFNPEDFPGDGSLEQERAVSITLCRERFAYTDLRPAPGA